MDDGNSTTTRLLTLLNVSATKAGKRKRVDEQKFIPAEKLNKRKTARFEDAKAISPPVDEEKNTKQSEKENKSDLAEKVEDLDEADDVTDLYEQHFGPSSSVLSNTSRIAADQNAWTVTKDEQGKLGGIVTSLPQGIESRGIAVVDILGKLKNSFKERQIRQPQHQTEIQNDLLSILATRRDLYLTSSLLDVKRATREAIALHAFNHVNKKRRRVLKNNERLSHATKTNPSTPPPEDVQDQGFTRPSVLFLLPFRSSALDWFRAITSHTPPPSFQIENQARFLAEYDLPPGAIDKLTSAEPGTYPLDHVEMFKGNVDDNFRVGVKVTRKSVKMFTEFYQCDIILASPLGLRRSIEKEGNADYLSSIEILVIDQTNALTMQNWDHVKFILSHMNKFPKESHDTDFSRIKPWYLEGYAQYLRQSILLSPFETPETRSLFTSLKNVAGKVRTERRWSPIEIPDGINQNFVRFDSSSPKDEPDKRFEYFINQLLPSILKSAVQSANTIIFIPSSFDFIRVHNYFRKHGGITYAVLSEYSSNQDISRARQAFFKGTKSFLLISERFHFFKRYKIRGIRNIIFYGPPDHPQFFTEFLSYPFLDEGVEASDVTCRVLYSKFDWFKLERIAGTETGVELIRT